MSNPRALPKEPRQKMINMMYLVLTALLALNVSSEILNAFKTVNNSITNANGVIDTKNSSVYSSFEALLKDGTTAEKAKIWQPYALQAKALSTKMDAYINNLKQTLKKESKPDDEKNPETFKEDNLEASSRLLVEEGGGQKLHDELENYKTQMLAILDPSKFPDPIIKKNVTAKRDEFTKNFPLDLSIPTSQTGSQKTDWSSAYFHMTPTIASITILSKFQNDVKNSESEMVDYFLSQVGSVKVVFDEFQPLIGTNATYLMPGDELEVTAGIGAYSKAATPKITINGSAPPIVDGKAVYKTAVSGAGEHTINYSITYTKPDGSTGNISKSLKYTVGTPSGSSVFLEKMNVLYAGVDNPMTISAGSAGLEKMSVVFSGSGSVTPQGGGRYIIKPGSVGSGSGNINVTVNGKTTPFPMRIKRLPDPQAMIGSNKGGSISTAQFKAIGGLFAKLDSEFDAPFTVISYSVGANGGSFQTYQGAPNDGARWTGNAAAFINKATPGTTVFFDQIKVKGPDGIRDIPPVIFQLK
ncbi:MAG: gliding motility protein GldM [Chitinophagaceae bacterium]